MTRKFPARLLRLGSLPLIAVMAVNACGPSASNTPAGSQGSVSASVAAAATPTKLATPSAQPETSPYGVGPSPTLPKSCLISVAEAESLVKTTGLTAGPNSTHTACVISGTSSNSPTVTTSVMSDFGASGYPAVSIPQGSPFKVAYAWKSNGFYQAVAELSDQSRWVDISLSNPLMGEQEQMVAVRTGLQNIMYWWSRSAAHSPASVTTPAVSSAQSGLSGARVPDLAACKVLPSSIFPDVLGGASVTGFDGSTATLCTLHTANPGVSAVIADRPQPQVDTSILVSVGHNVWEEDASTFMTFVKGYEIGVAAFGTSLVNTQDVIAALAALNT